MKINLNQMARAQGVNRKSVTLRVITPTQVQARDLYRIYLRVVSVWSDRLKSRLLPEYGRTVSELATDSVIDMEVIIKLIADYAATVEISLAMDLERWVSALVRWHTTRIVTNVRYVTNVDLTTLIGPPENPITIDEFMVRNTALIRDVSDQVRGRVADIVFRNAQLRTPLREVAKEIAEATGLARKRSMRIAMDQTQKLSASLDRDRQTQLGIEEFEWLHSAKQHPRLEHLARDHKIFRWDSDVARTDPPGFAPFCGCKAKGVLRLT